MTERISDYFDLDLQQPSLDFIDVYTDKDIKLFIDPKAFVTIQSEWGQMCLSLIKDYFSTLLLQIKTADKTGGMQTLKGLSEPRETRLGWSNDTANGRGVGLERSEMIWEALSKSAAVETGLVPYPS